MFSDRPNCLPGANILAGEKPGGGTVDYCWIIMQKQYFGFPMLGWLAKPKGINMVAKIADDMEAIRAGLARLEERTDAASAAIQTPSACSCGGISEEILASP